MNGRGPVILAAVFSLVLLSLGAAYVVFRTYVPPASATSPIAPESRQFDLVLHRFDAGEGEVRRWMPPVLIANVGDTVILRLTNGDSESAHGFTLAAFNQAVPAIQPGQTVTLRFKAARAGIFHYGCSLVGCAPDHASQVGQFVVLQGR